MVRSSSGRKKITVRFLKQINSKTVRRCGNNVDLVREGDAGFGLERIGDEGNW
ncbi:hypothetical protein MtrunA17_Chr1g0212041 [Medicago truncatula]|uniref:Uncharacterized protein n=1 Tax=Medicago truncatula TaxID=3880 RepID=A0A396KBR0_MEDTR|nr:hypothetical protein MtrunA17_Chr1g0212041 [Medicago truncatula]